MTRFERLCNPEFQKLHKGLISGLTDAIGLTDYSGAEAQQQAALDATKYGTDASVALARENIAFQREQLDYQKTQYEDWKNVYGTLQDNLGEFYNNLSPDKYAAQMTTALNKEFSQAKRETAQILAQKGLTGSGADVASAIALTAQKAQSMAQVPMAAEDKVLAMKQGFLGIGLGQGTSLLGVQAQQAGTIGNAYNTASSNQLQGGIAQGNIGSAYAQTNLQGSYGVTNNLIQSYTSMNNSAMNAGSNLLGGMMSSDKRLKTNIKLVDIKNGINLYTWEWNDLADELGYTYQPNYGVIAQEVAELGVVETDANGYLVVNYDKLKGLIA